MSLNQVRACTLLYSKTDSSHRPKSQQFSSLDSVLSMLHVVHVKIANMRSDMANVEVRAGFTETCDSEMV